LDLNDDDDMVFFFFFFLPFFFHEKMESPRRCIFLVHIVTRNDFLIDTDGHLSKPWPEALTTLTTRLLRCCPGPGPAPEPISTPVRPTLTASPASHCVFLSPAVPVDGDLVDLRGCESVVRTAVSFTLQRLPVLVGHLAEDAAGARVVVVVVVGVAPAVQLVTRAVTGLVGVEEVAGCVVEEGVEFGGALERLEEVVARASRERQALAEEDLELGLPSGAWEKRLSVVLSMCDSPPAVSAALTAAMREFRPSTAHFSTPAFRPSTALTSTLSAGHLPTLAKTAAAAAAATPQLSRRATPIVIVQTFSATDACPPRPIEHPALSEHERLCARRMAVFARQFREEGVPSSDLSSFWLRKSQKATLSVLMVKGEPGGDGAPQYFHGMNLEVSLPTGSLCSERAAIGAAVAARPGLKRSDFLCIAVFAPPFLSSQGRNPIDPCGACREWLEKISVVNPGFKILTFSGPDWDWGRQRIISKTFFS
jgi:hypothetical protein